jgi:hypothetical protein
MFSKHTILAGYYPTTSQRSSQAEKRSWVKGRSPTLAMLAIWFSPRGHTPSETKANHAALIDDEPISLAR